MNSMAAEVGERGTGNGEQMFILGSQFPVPSSLFPELALQTPRYGPGWYGKRKRGRGATPRIERDWIAQRANPAGRRRLKYRFRPLKRHSGRYVNPHTHTPLIPPRTVWEVACILIAEYFERIGGFWIADDAVITAWADALSDYTLQEIRWAIEAKAKSLEADTVEERRAKRVYVPRPEAFPSLISQWLEKSPDYEARSDARTDAALAEKRKRRGAVNKIIAEHYEDLLVQGDRAEIQHFRQLEQERLQREAEEREAADQRFWQSLTDRQRADAIKAVRANHTQMARIGDLQPDQPAYQRLLHKMALDWGRTQWELKDPAPEGNRQGAKVAKNTEESEHV